MSGGGQLVSRWIEIAGVLRISCDDGAVSIRDGTSLDDAARAFWRAVEKWSLRSEIAFAVQARHQTEASLRTTENALAAMEARAKQSDRILAWLERKGVATRPKAPSDTGSGVHCWEMGNGDRRWSAHYVGSEFGSLREAALAAMEYEESNPVRGGCGEGR